MERDWDYILISDEGASESVYKHNVGNRGEFYGTVEDSYVTLIVNPNGTIVNSYDTLDIRTESTSSGTDVVEDIFYNMTAENSTQSITRALSFSMSNVDPVKGNTYNTGTIKRIARIWRTPIMQAQTSGADFRRLVDTYVKIKLDYDNTNNYTFKLHDIVTFFRETKR